MYHPQFRLVVLKAYSCVRNIYNVVDCPPPLCDEADGKEVIKINDSRMCVRTHGDEEYGTIDLFFLYLP